MRGAPDEVLRKTILFRRHDPVQPGERLRRSRVPSRLPAVGYELPGGLDAGGNLGWQGRAPAKGRRDSGRGCRTAALPRRPGVPSDDPVVAGDPQGRKRRRRAAAGARPWDAERPEEARVETKDYRGWIFANAKQANWTQVLFKRKFRFQNPIFQNSRHVRAVQRLLDFLQPGAIRSLVVFTGEAEFKTAVPQGVFNLSGLIEYLHGQTVEVMSLNRMQFCVGRLETARLAISGETDVQRVQSLERRHRSAHRPIGRSTRRAPPRARSLTQDSRGKLWRRGAPLARRVRRP